MSDIKINKDAKVLVFGSFNADLTMKTKRFPRPGESLLGGPFTTGTGGKGANQAVAAAKVGANVTMITKVGNDVFSHLVYEVFDKVGICKDYIAKDDNNTTGTAFIEVENDTAENAIVLAPGANETVTKEDIDRAEKAFEEADIFLTQLENNVEMNEYFIKKASAYGKRIVLNTAPAKKVDEEIFKYVDFITPNETETEFFTGVVVKNEDDMDRAADILKAKGVKNVIITLGSKGVYVNADEYGVKGVFPAFKSDNPKDTTGAGDAFNGGFTAALASGNDVVSAVRFGCAVAGVSVTRDGASSSMPTFEEAKALFDRK